VLHNRPRFEQWLPALFDGLFHWDFLTPAFNGTKITPMDFDAVIERKGHVLIFETKITGKKVDIGPSITLTDQWRKGATIFCVSGKTAESIDGMACYWEGGYEKGVTVGEKALVPVKWDDVLFQTRRWFCHADGITEPTREQWDTELWRWDFERTAEKETSAAQAVG
jgi:hypothetical protein